MKAPKNIVRYEHNHFRGWQVAVRRNGVRYQRYVSDSSAGGKQKALHAAIKLRDELIGSLPAPAERPSSRNTTGVVGVYVLRAGKKVAGYGASWQAADGARVRKSYSVARWGDKKAKALAIQARRAASAVAKGDRPSS